MKRRAPSSKWASTPTWAFSISRAPGRSALALDLILIVVVTSLVRDRLGHRGWRAIHMLTYVAWGLGVLHGVGIGTDSETSWGTGVTIASIGAVGVAVIVRGATYWHERRLAA